MLKAPFEVALLSARNLNVNRGGPRKADMFLQRVWHSLTSSLRLGVLWHFLRQWL